MYGTNMPPFVATKNKYRAKKTVVDGITFDSAREARRYSELKLLERAGEISRLELQPSFQYKIGGQKMFIYRADFVYFTKDKCIVEDVKGFRTPIYKLKKKIIETAYHVQIQEV